MHLTFMSVLLIWLLRGVLGAPSNKDWPSYWASKLFPKTNSIYFMSKKKSLFSLHRMNKLCKAIGGYLVELDSREEQKFVTGFMRAHDKYIAFTGGNDVMQEGTFVYYNSKTPMPALKWRPSNPDNWNNDEDCVQIWWNGLNDIGCSRRSKYICEISL
ncbi:collectin-11 [Plakobranchus ocellatus]|uniref:Collectin-11 n=1 Tax=Plakobranchus ocellatus TaxID=259542 RepID=A0AAV3YWV8_9GAST|nr:collectin-11 [Plakobranchus ocellatus]